MSTTGRKSAENLSQSPPKFFFVDEGSSSKGKRSHVMKQYMHSRRKEKNAALFGRTSRPLPRQPRYLAWRKRTDENALGERGCDDNNPNPQTPSPSKKTATCALATGQYHELWNSPGSLSCQTTVAANRIDPFDTLPWSYNDEDRHLMNCWTWNLSSWSGQNHFMKKSVFRDAMQHSMTFHVCVLTYSARYLASVHQDEDNLLRCSSYISTAENMVATYLKKGQRQGDCISTMALTALSVQEARYGNRQKSRHYLDNAVQSLRSQDGKRLAGDTYTHYGRLTMFRQDLPFNMKHASQLLSFLQNAETLALSHSTPAFLSIAPQRKAAFEYMTPLHTTLSGGPHPSKVPEKDRVWVLKYELSGLCRVSALVYLNKALWDQRSSPEACVRYLNNIMANGREHLEPNFPIESFLWLLLQDNCDFGLRNPGRAWFVGDIMESFKQIPQLLQFQFSELLLSFLMLKPPDFNITLEGFERQILQFAQPEYKVPVVE
ncbi:hypothetical protein GX51_02898 [Blastomyces parvus]|uniref:Uncharacterized protein n=1 Tax=Blastomyces parvus TaxID=2060905 RepID=A0A2B7X9I6_9EURO|nr:hypothetical protein GX51_02898 [Blastomyces parvus]